MLEPWQAEWFPYFHRLRLRLTGLGLDWVAMDGATGTRSIPALVDAIVAYLDERRAEPYDGGRRRAQMRAEWPHWLGLEGGGQGH
jgi:hypothetical protein